MEELEDLQDAVMAFERLLCASEPASTFWKKIHGGLCILNDGGSDGSDNDN
jgi:hypothetical protein